MVTNVVQTYKIQNGQEESARKGRNTGEKQKASSPGVFVEMVSSTRK